MGEGDTDVSEGGEMKGKRHMKGKGRAEVLKGGAMMS